MATILNFNQFVDNSEKKKGNVTKKARFKEALR